MHEVRLPVGDVARLAGVSVRTLHHYDEIGLVTPSERTASGYRQYSARDLEVLHRVLGYRELGFSLDQIAAILADCDELGEHLRRQRRLLAERIERLQRMAANVERALEAYMTGINLTPDEIFEVFGDVDPNAYAEEAEQRWGETEAYAESRRRTARYGKHEWQRIKAEADSVEARFAQLLRDGTAPPSNPAMDAAEEHRAHIERWFYPVSHAMHRGLAGLYIDDARFTAHYDEIEPGLARFVHDAIEANADRFDRGAGGGSATA
jgi:DNA-binding transcriptional MerR regulator